MLMKKKTLFAGFMAIALGMTMAVQAQERAAGGTTETQMTWSALSSKVDLSLAESKGVNTRVDKVVVCNKKGMLYTPDKSGADKDACSFPVVKDVPTDPSLTSLLRCNAKATFYMPTHASADKQGCLAPNVKDINKTVAVAGGCTGRNCSVNINMTPYLNFPEVSFGATCSGPWCLDADYKPITDFAKLPSLTSSWSGLWIVGLRTGRKQSFVEGDYNAKTKILTLTVRYVGDSTDANLSTIKLYDMKVMYTYRTLVLP